MRCSLPHLLKRRGQQDEGEAQYNTGDEEDRRQALSSAVGQSRLLLSVAAGTIVLSATFLSAIYVGRSLCLLVAAWIVLGISMFVGFVVHGEYTAQLAESDLTVRRGRLEVEMLVQLVAVLAGLSCFGLFVLGNVDAGPQLEIRRAAVDSARGEVTVSISCRSGAGTGCRGEVTLRQSPGPANQRSATPCSRKTRMARTRYMCASRHSLSGGWSETTPTAPSRSKCALRVGSGTNRSRPKPSRLKTRPRASKRVPLGTSSSGRRLVALAVGNGGDAGAGVAGGPACLRG